MKQYNKLIRDHIPEIIVSEGKSAKIHEADEDEYKIKLYEKLGEEVEELKAEPSLEEAADLQEVFLAVFKLQGWDLKELEEVRLKKLKERGGFEKRLILDAVL
jgi:predicted house-cleaning noncanonical NTP pyrophosphatase (MazG superfamily)